MLLYIIFKYGGNLIGICGGSASGKTTVARKIIEALDIQWVSILSMDSFYKVSIHLQLICTKRKAIPPSLSH